MSNAKFPKRKKQKAKGQSGQTFVQHFITETLGWIYHPISEENDFGIDGYIEIVDGEIVTGKLIAVQIKCGNSYFMRRTSHGYRYLGELKHLNYYMNSSCPVLIIIVRANFSEMYWSLFDIAATSPTKKGWWIEIPTQNRLTNTTKGELRELAGPVVDFEKTARYNWEINNAIKESGLLLVAIPRREIELSSFEYIVTLIERLTKTKEMMLKIRSTFDIFFPEYDNDEREIHEIPEILSWLKQSIELGIPWFYFLRYDGYSAALKLLPFSYCQATNITKKDTGNPIELDGQCLSRYMEKGFINLNKFTEIQNIGMKINKEISKGIFEYYKRETVLPEK